jgi:hypothetical protein
VAAERDHRVDGAGRLVARLPGHRHLDVVLERGRGRTWVQRIDSDAAWRELLRGGSHQSDLACLAAQHPLRPGNPMSPATLETMTMLPPSAGSTFPIQSSKHWSS